MRSPAWMLAFALFSFLGSFAQTDGQVYSKTVETEIRNFENAWEREEFSAARAAFTRIYAEDPSAAWRVGEQIEILISGRASPGMQLPPLPAQLDTLCNVFESGIANDRENSYDWQVRKGLLMLNYRDHFADRIEATLLTCSRANPLQCPPLLIENLVEMYVKDYEDSKLAETDLMKFWVETENMLLERMALQAASEPMLRQIHEGLRRDLVAALPDCGKIDRMYGKDAENDRLNSNDWRTLLQLLDLKDCRDFASHRRAVERVIAQHPGPYWLRKAVDWSADIDESITLLRLAADKEPNPRLKAADEVRIAWLQRLQGNFAEARTSLENARLLAPEWGQPLLHLADLYAAGAPRCDIPDFDKKAVYWAAIDFCTEAKNTDPFVEEEANRRIFEYRGRMPTKREVAFMNLKAGDTYPLRCWMDVATTVKVD